MSATSQWFDQNGESKYDLITAASLGDLNLVEDILRNNLADVNAVNSAGWTPLMYASHYGHYNVIRILVQYNSIVNYQDRSQGRTALMLAASNGHTRTIETLLNYGKADKSIKDFMGHDAVYYAKTCGHGNNKMIKSLLGKGEGYELKGRSCSAPLVPKVTVTPSSPVAETTRLNSISSNVSSNESVIYNPCEPTVFSSNLSSYWRPITRQNKIESQTTTSAHTVPTAMPPQLSTSLLDSLTNRVQVLEERVKYLELMKN